MLRKKDWKNDDVPVQCQFYTDIYNHLPQQQEKLKRG